MATRVWWIVVAFYAAACLFSLTAMFGDEPRPIVGMFALLLALPWSTVLAVFGKLSPLASLLILTICMALNTALLIGMITARQQRQRKTQS